MATTSSSNGHTSGIYEDTILPPHNEDAEASVLGSILIDPARFSELDLEPIMFFRSLHRQIYQAFQTLAQNKTPIDLITVTDILRGKEIEEEPYLIGLLTVVPTSVNIIAYANIVREMFNRRRLIAHAGKLASGAYDLEETLDDVISGTMEGVRAVGSDASSGEPLPIYTLCDKTLDELTDRRENPAAQKAAMLATGFVDLDRLLLGLEPGSFVVSAGRPGMGKSVLEQNIRMNITKSGKRVVAFNLEMSSAQLIYRALSSRLQVPYKTITNPSQLTAQQWKILLKGIGEMSKLPMYIDDTPSLSIDQIHAKAHALVAAHGPVDLITVDYLQLMRGRKNAKNRVIEIGQISRGLKELSRDLDTVVWANAQVNRSVENRPIKKPNLSDLRESGDIEQDADVVMFIYRDEYYNPETVRANIAEIDVQKNRNGDLGQVDLYFNGAKMMFRDLARQEVSF